MFIDFSNIDFDQIVETNEIPRYIIDVKDYYLPLLIKGSQVLDQLSNQSNINCIRNFIINVNRGMIREGEYEYDHITVDNIKYYGNSLHMCIPLLINQIKEVEPNYDFFNRESKEEISDNSEYNSNKAYPDDGGYPDYPVSDDSDQDTLDEINYNPSLKIEEKVKIANRYIRRIGSKDPLVIFEKMELENYSKDIAEYLQRIGRFYE